MLKYKQFLRWISQC